ncbi:conserved hypothetical protein [Paenibacillus curdlanolyticus YK9]|uniref:Uncharacterized protein n=1 Tax=Paenibacillus curdlanolyticus YK9 TaxID=717606 RepID=E0I622_9BACL|nr:hypothetical protein [Paenibacillus curdlanolyticus]EFM12414.1 conserved hypothetical protein [Paenibacillus curdlanolyticus YK9]
MARNKEKSFQGKQQAMRAHDREAENNVAASTEENRNQKGHVPNSPSTG